MTAKRWIGGGGLAAVLVVLYLDQRGTSEELAALRGSLAQTRGEQADQRRANLPTVAWRSPARTGEPLPSRGRDGDDAPPAPALAKAQPQTPIEEFARVHDTLEHSFDAQGSDGGWAMEARRSLESNLSDLPVSSRIRSIECRSTLCRLETLHDRPADARDFTSRFASLVQRPWNGGFYTGPIAEDPRSGALTFVTYLVREGMELPPIRDDVDTASR